MKVKYLIGTAIAIAAIASCKPKEPDLVAEVRLQSETIAFPVAGDIKTVGISANSDWTASVSESWARVAPENGNASTTSISIQVAENTTGEARQATLTVTCGSATASATITQAGEVAVGGIETAEGFISFLAEAPASTEADEYDITADIDMGGAVVTPASTFSGVLNGHNHKIYNYKVQSSEPNSGFFLNNSGTIKDLILGSKDGNAYDGTSAVSYMDNVETINFTGGVAAVNDGTIENVKNFAKVIFPAACKTAELSGIGGIAGKADKASTIYGCGNWGTIVALGSIGAEYYVGGIIAYMNNADVMIEKCTNNVPIEISLFVNKASMFGGIAGRANLGGIIKDCQNNSSITYNQPEETGGTYMMIAGVVGALYTGSQALGCTNKGDVTSTRLQVSRIGGIVGTLNSTGVVADCVNDGNITLRHAAPNVNWQSAGGIVGFEEKGDIGNIIRNNTNNGKVTVDVEILGTHASNRVHAGGILGLGNLGIEIYENINNGEISATNRATGSDNAIQIEAGGIVGGIRGPQSYTRANVNNGKVSCNAGAFGFCGGIAAHVGSLATNAADATIRLSSDENKAAITGSEPTKTGSVAGVNDGIISECVAGGSVNGATLDDSNFVTLSVGTNNGKIENLKSPSGSSASSKSLDVDKTEIRVEASVTSASFSIESNVSWSVACAETWITSFTKSGSNNGTVEIAFSANTSTTDDRTATFTVSAEGVDSKTVTLIQGKVLDAAPHCLPSADELDLMAIEALKEAPDFSRWTDGSGVIKITADIDATKLTSLPVKTIPADITIDGQNHTITLALESTGQFTGLFQEFKGTLKNLKTAGSVKTVYAGGDEYRISPMICTLAGGVVDKCTNEAVIINAGAGSPNNKYSYAGGIVAVFNTDGASITNCVNNGNITIENNSCAMAGGIVSYGQTNSSAPTLTIENCQNHGNIVLNHTGGNWDYIGGIIGKVGASSNPFTNFIVKNCSSDANITIDKAPKLRGGGLIGSGGATSTYEFADNVYSGTITVNSEETVDRLIGGCAPGYSEAAAVGKVTNCTFSGKILAAKDGGNIYFGGIYGNNGSADIVIDGCKTTAASVIDGGTAPKSIGVIAARPNAAGFTVKDCKIAGQVNMGTGMITITKDNIEDWMFKGSATTVDVTLTNNGFNE